MAQAKLKFLVQGDDLAGVVDEEIRAAGGDHRVAILGLIRGQHHLEAEASTRTSVGYVRRDVRS